MSSTRAKGRATELKVKKWLEKQGYIVHLAPTSRMYQQNQDIFSLWDAVCLLPGREIMFCQIKSNRNSIYGKRLNVHRAWPTPSGVRKLAILWEPHKRLPEIIELLNR